MTAPTSYSRFRTRDAWTMARAYVRNDAVEDISYPASIVIGQIVAVAPVVIYYFIAQLRPASHGVAAARVGYDYFTFVVIGTAVAVALAASLGGFGIALQTAYNRGQFEMLLVEPVPWVLIPIAMNLWRSFLGVVSALLILVLGGLLGASYQLSGLFVFLLVLLPLGIIATSIVGTLSACLLILSKRSQPVLALYGILASLVGGALFPISLMPGWLRAIAAVVPHAYVISASRAALMSPAPTDSISLRTAIIALIIFNVVVGIASFFLFKKSLEYARQRGILGDY